MYTFLCMDVQNNFKGGLRKSNWRKIQIPDIKSKNNHPSV